MIEGIFFNLGFLEGLGISCSSCQIITGWSLRGEPWSSLPVASKSHYFDGHGPWPILAHIVRGC